MNAPNQEKPSTASRSPNFVNSSESRPAKPVIQSWLTTLLGAAVLVTAVVNGWLILELGRFERDREIAAERAAVLATTRQQLSAIQIEFEGLRRQKDSLSPLVADWEKRASQRAVSEVAIASLEEKKRRLDTDVESATSRLGQLAPKLADLDSRKTDLTNDCSPSVGASNATRRKIEWPAGFWKD